MNKELINVLVESFQSGLLIYKDGENKTINCGKIRSCLHCPSEIANFCGDEVAIDSRGLEIIEHLKPIIPEYFI